MTRRILLAVALALTVVGCAGVSSPTGTTQATPQPTPEPAATSSAQATPTAITTPTAPPPAQPTPTPRASIQPVITPAPFVSDDFKAIVEHFVDFDDAGLLQDSGRHIQIRYSRNLLDSAGIEGVAVDAETMAEVRQVLIAEVRKAARRVGQGGSTTHFGNGRGQSFQANLETVNLLCYSVEKGDMGSIVNSLVANDVIYLNAYSGLVAKVGATIVVLTGGTFGRVDPQWDRLDAAARLVGAGPATLMQALKYAALKWDRDEFTVTAPNPVYEALGLIESNNWGSDGDRGKLKIVFR